MLGKKKKLINQPGREPTKPNTMKAHEIKSDSTVNMIYRHEPGTHYSFLMSLGRVIPMSKAQAETFYKMYRKNAPMSVMTLKDVTDYIEPILNKHGFEGEYKYTKSKQYVRLQNTSDLAVAFKNEF